MIGRALAESGRRRPLIRVHSVRRPRATQHGNSGSLMLFFRDMRKRALEAGQRSASRSLGPGEEPLDALKWLQRELQEIDRLITRELERSQPELP